MKRFSMLALAWSSAWTTAAYAADGEQTVETIIVTATPLGQTADQLAQPAEVLSGDQLDDKRRNTIGETLEREPGISTTDFGPGAGRPVIRGQPGPRIQVLENGIPSMDASDVSTDHAVTIDPTSSTQVEVLKGPATLLYGGGASAGVINIVNDRLPTKVDDGLHGGVNGYGASNAADRLGSVDVSYGTGMNVFHVDYASRDSNNYDIPGNAHTDGTGSQDKLANSSVSLHSNAFSYALIGDAGSIAVARTQFDTKYGLPVEETAFIDMNETRYDVQGVLNDPTSFLDSVRLSGAYNDYQHTEFEAPHEAGTVFRNNQGQGRLEAVLTPMDEWRGALGVQYDHRDFSAIGEEAFVPPTITKNYGLFLVEQRPFSWGSLELGGRVQRDEQDPDIGQEKDFTPLSASVGTVFDVGDNHHLKFFATRSERSPVAEELYAFGPHGATETFERGDENLDKETANNIDVVFDTHGDVLSWQVDLYYNRIENYTFVVNVDQGLNADGTGVPAADGVADRVDADGTFNPAGELLLVDYVQKTAKFYGGEAELQYRIAKEPVSLTANLFGDIVWAELSSGDNLPRIPPARYGVGLDASRGAWRGNVTVERVLTKDNLAPLETPTQGYNMLTADVGFRLPFFAGSNAEIYLQGRNLLDAEVRRATSFLKDVAPAPGVSVLMGLRITM